MKNIKHFMLPEHTNDLYKNEAISSISLTKEVASKINELVDAYNKLNQTNYEKIQEQDGKIAKGILYMKDNIKNTVEDLLDTLEYSGELKEIIKDTLFNEITSKLPETISVKEYGAIGDGIHDDYNAFMKAIENGVTVTVPSGRYYISKPIIIPWGKSLIGDENGSVIIVDDNTFVILTGRNTVKNFKIENTVNTKDSTMVTPTEPLIKGQMGYSKIENIYIGLAYIGIDVELQGRSTIRDIFGCPLKYGIKIDNSVDVTFVDNVHFNQNYYGEINPVLKNFMFEQGYAMYIGRADWGNASNVFCLGYKGLVYITNGSSRGGSANNFVFDNWGCDGCKSLFTIRNYAGGFKFINGNGTFYNIFYNDILNAGLTPSKGDQYPISLTLDYNEGASFEEPIMTFINNRFYRSDENLMLCNARTGVIFKGNTIYNAHTNQPTNGTPPTIYLGGNSTCNISDNIFKNNSENENIIGIMNTDSNPNSVINGNIFINYNIGVQNPNISTTNNNLVSL